MWRLECRENWVRVKSNLGKWKICRFSKIITLDFRTNEWSHEWMYIQEQCLKFDCASARRPPSRSIVFKSHFPQFSRIALATHIRSFVNSGTYALHTKFQISSTFAWASGSPPNKSGKRQSIWKCEDGCKNLSLRLFEN